MGSRILTAAVGIPLLMYVATARSFVPAAVFSLLLAVLCAVEVAISMRGKGVQFPMWLQVVSRLPYLLLMTAVLLNFTVDELLFYGALTSFVGLIAAVRIKQAGVTFPPYTLWIALPAACVIAVRVFDTRVTEGVAELVFGTALLLLFLCLWAGDTAAYLVGRSLGKNKLAPLVSPNKTWEGAIANLAAAAVVGYLAAEWCKLTPMLGLAVGATVGVFGQAGDLYESAWKRSIGIKDSGNLLPGHGGFLDRFDSLLFSAPPVALLLYSGWLR